MRRHLLLLYGQDDPWRAQRFILGPGSSDSASYTIAGGNHVTPYTALPPAQQKAFVDRILSWAGLPDSTTPLTTTGPSLAAITRLTGH